VSELSERLVTALERLAVAHEVHAQAHAQLATAHAQLALVANAAFEHGITLRGFGMTAYPEGDHYRIEFDTE